MPLFGRTANQETALGRAYIKRRVFIWVVARDPITGDPDPVGLWDDLGNIEYDGKVYNGSGNVVSVSSIGARGDLSIPKFTVTLSGIETASLALLDDTDLDQAAITIQLGIYDTEARALLPPLYPYASGYIDDVDAPVPEAGGRATITFTCESTSRALTIERPDTRSAESISERFPADTFYNYTAVQREKPLYFGRATP